jgi:hypothetical protein
MFFLNLTIIIPTISKQLILILPLKKFILKIGFFLDYIKPLLKFKGIEQLKLTPLSKGVFSVG